MEYQCKQIIIGNINAMLKANIYLLNIDNECKYSVGNVNIQFLWKDLIRSDVETLLKNETN